MKKDEETGRAAYAALHAALTHYAPLSEPTWQALKAVTALRQQKKGALLYRVGEVPTHYSFVVQGLVRCVASDAGGNEYNKKFFSEGMFPGAMSALLTGAPSRLAFEALEDVRIIDIDFQAYRRLLTQHHDLALLQIHYLETNWLLEKDAREIEIVQEDATQRYLRFLQSHADIVERLPQYHIASHLGVTPTQLSRIRKKLAADQPM